MTSHAAHHAALALALCAVQALAGCGSDDSVELPLR